MKSDKLPTERLSGLLGMARRAGRLTIGFHAVAARITDGKTDLVLFAADLSEKTGKELQYAAKEKTVKMFRIPLGKQELAHILGCEKPVGVLAIEDKGFAASIEKLCRHELEEECIL